MQPPAIALVDDDAVQLQLLKAQFTKLGANVSTFSSGDEFLRQRRGGSMWDLIVVCYLHHRHTAEHFFLTPESLNCLVLDRLPDASDERSRNNRLPETNSGGSNEHLYAQVTFAPSTTVDRSDTVHSRPSIYKPAALLTASFLVRLSTVKFR